MRRASECGDLVQRMAGPKPRRKGPERSGPLVRRKGCFQSALAVPTASEAATAMETPEAATDMAETSSMGDTHAVRETATSIMGGTKAAIHTYGATHPTHAAMAEAMIEAAVVRVPAIKYVGVAVIAVIPA